MPFTSDIIHEINVYLQNYVKYKTTGSDIAQKQKEINRIQSLITTAKLKKSPDSDWIPILLEIGRTADDSQRKGTYCSKFTETLYMVLHRLRRELDKEILDQAIQKELYELSALKNKYVQAKKANQKIEALQDTELEIDNRICKIAHLGELGPLLELDLDETATLFSGTVKKAVPLSFVYKLFTNEVEEIKGYEYSDATTLYSVTDVNTTLPLVVQHGENLTFEKIYLAKYLNGVRPEPKDHINERRLASPARSAAPTPLTVVPVVQESKHIKLSQISPLSLNPEPPAFELKRPESKELISESFVLELTNDLNNYTLGKTHGFDLALKIKECNEISTLLTHHFQNKASSDEWLDLIITIGEQADRIQNSGRTCSGCTEVFYFILHKLRKEIAKNAPNALAERLERENQELIKQQTKSKNSKWGNEKLASLDQAESAIYKARKRLAYLGNLDPLLSIKRAKFEKMYSGSCNDMFAGFIVHYFSGTPIIGFEYTRTPNTYDLPHTFCTYLPVVLQNGFVDFYLKKYEKKLKAASNAKVASEGAEKAIRDLEMEIKKLSESKNVIELIANHQKDEKALAEVGLTFQEVNKTIDEPIKQIELSIEMTRNYITHMMGERKEDLSKNLSKKIEELGIIKKSLAVVLKTFESAQEQLKLQSAKSDEQKGPGSQTSIISLLQQHLVPPPLVNADESELKTPENDPLPHLDDLISDDSSLEADIAAALADFPAISHESKNHPAPLVGQGARLELFEKIADKRGIKEQNKSKRFVEWEKEFSKDKSIIQRFLKELSEAGKELEGDFELRASA